jgi:hypothetical protein
MTCFAGGAGKKSAEKTIYEDRVGKNKRNSNLTGAFGGEKQRILAVLV